VGEAFKRLLQAVRFERDAFVWMDFNDRASGDAMILVLLTSLGLVLARGFTVFGLVTSTTGVSYLFGSLVSSAIFWLAYAGLVYFVVTRLFQASGSYAIFLRIVGFAFPTLLLLIFTARLGLGGLPGFLLGAVWFLAIVTQGIRYDSELPVEKAAAAAGLSMVLWVVVAQIFGRNII
jgi:hypothetical protein